MGPFLVGLSRLPLALRVTTSFSVFLSRERKKDAAPVTILGGCIVTTGTKHEHSTTGWISCGALAEAVLVFARQPLPAYFPFFSLFRFLVLPVVFSPFLLMTLMTNDDSAFKSCRGHGKNGEHRAVVPFLLEISLSLFSVTT